MSRTLAPDAYSHAPKVMGVDVARFGDDQSVISLRQGLKSYPQRKYRGLDTMTLAGIVAQAIDEENSLALTFAQRVHATDMRLEAYAARRSSPFIRFDDDEPEYDGHMGFAEGIRTSFL